MKLKNLLFLTFALLWSAMLTAQVTTSGMNGKVTGINGESLPSATVVAVHTPSGTQYGTLTDLNGNYQIANMRVGGPYSLTISYVGYKPYVKSDIILNLGQTLGTDVNLVEESSQISGVTVVSKRNAIIDGNRTGASTNLRTEQIQSLPTITRSITDFTRLSPQSNGNSFAGRDGRYNNITIDGANFNNNFGLSTKALPGGDAQPISLDAIEEISVNVAPFDIRQSNFTGANVNAVTAAVTIHGKDLPTDITVINRSTEAKLRIRNLHSLTRQLQTTVFVLADLSSRTNSSSSPMLKKKSLHIQAFHGSQVPTELEIPISLFRVLPPLTWKPCVITL